MSVRCSEGHDSTELDYCSVCGRAMPSRSAPARAESVAAPHGPAPSDVRVCPSCSEPRADRDARFCEVCRYDFVSRKLGPPPARATPTPPDPAPARPVAAPAGNAVSVGAGVSTGSRNWQLVITVDSALDVEPDPQTPCPRGAPEEIVALDRDILVGRRDDRRDIVPELPLNDPGASRRHAKFVRGADGTPALQDLASTNGTRLNDADVAPGSRVALKEGDEITLGRWTRIKVRTQG
jgi:pSer/pThr/pTyr-binding forkhead associated (FHA) protein